jgi:hypothetical protein
MTSRLGRGDAAPSVQPEMIHVVRRVLRLGKPRTSVDRRILAEADRLGGRESLDQEQLVRRVAQSLCAILMSNVVPGGGRPANPTITDMVSTAL